MTRIFGWVFLGAMIVATGYGTTAWPHDAIKIAKRHCGPPPACDVASQAEWNGTTVITPEMMNQPYCPDGAVCSTGIEPPPTVTIPGPLVIETDGSLITLDGGPLSFDGHSWTYKGKFHGDGSIVFKAAKTGERE